MMAKRERNVYDEGAIVRDLEMARQNVGKLQVENRYLREMLEQIDAATELFEVKQLVGVALGLYDE